MCYVVCLFKAKGSFKKPYGYLAVQGQRPLQEALRLLRSLPPIPPAPAFAVSRFSRNLTRAALITGPKLPTATLEGANPPLDVFRLPPPTRCPHEAQAPNPEDPILL